MKCLIRINNDAKDPLNIDKTFVADVQDKGLTATVRPIGEVERVYMNKFTDPERGFSVLGIFEGEEYQPKTREELAELFGTKVELPHHLQNITITLTGQKRFFRCDCGCNVFHKFTEESEQYFCNSCNVSYTAEKS